MILAFLLITFIFTEHLDLYKIYSNGTCLSYFSYHVSDGE